MHFCPAASRLYRSLRTEQTTVLGFMMQVEKVGLDISQRGSKTPKTSWSSDAAACRYSPFIPRIVKHILQFKRKSCFSVLRCMFHVSLYRSVSDLHELAQASKYLILWDKLKISRFALNVGGWWWSSDFEDSKLWNCFEDWCLKVLTKVQRAYFECKSYPWNGDWMEVCKLIMARKGRLPLAFPDVSSQGYGLDIFPKATAFQVRILHTHLNKE